MTPAALGTYRGLRTLGLPAKVWRKITIAVDGRPCFAALSDPELDAVLREVRRKYPLVDPAQQGGGSAQGGG